MVCEQLPDTHPQKKVLTAYRQAYESRYQEDVSAFGGYAHDALMIVLEGLRRAGEPDRSKVREAIEHLSNYAGVTGVFNFSPTDHTGLTLDAFLMLVVKDGKFTIYQP
jgi:branched-chain amino acid transport system substrate-binding protein